MDRFDLALALALLVGLALTAQVVRLLATAGFETLRYAVWIAGYGSVVLAAWWVWIRPLDIRAPGEAGESVWDTDDADDAADSE